MTKLEKPPADLELKRRIAELIEYKGGGYNQESVADIIESALKLLTDVKDSGDVRVIQTAIRELRYAFKLFAPYSQTRKVTIFGSARTQPTRRTTAAVLGKIPTTSVRRLTSLFKRSNGLVECNLVRCWAGKPM